jgi:hypothetical protein
MKIYTFEVVCKNGEKKTFTCEAESFDQARNLLAVFVRENQ